VEKLMENEKEIQGSQNPEEEESLDSLNETETQEGETDEEKIAKLEDANKKLFARAKKAEEEAKALKNKPQEEKPKEEPKPTPTPVDDIDRKIEEKINERDLASMDLSDELKSEVKTYAKAKGISYRDAEKSEYIGFLKQKEAEKIKAEEASATSKGIGIKTKRDFANLSDEQINNLSDEEWKEYKIWLKETQK